MLYVGIDVGKLSHMFCVVDSFTGKILLDPLPFKNDKLGFDLLINKLRSFPKKEILIGMEDTGHYHFNLLKFLLNSGYSVALINPVTTDLTREHHDLKEQLNVYTNKLQKCIDIVFPEYNSLFRSKYGTVL